MPGKHRLESADTPEKNGAGWYLGKRWTMPAISGLQNFESEKRWFSGSFPTQILLSLPRCPIFGTPRVEISQGKQSRTPSLCHRVCTWAGSHIQKACGTDSCSWQFPDTLSCSIRIAASRSGMDVLPCIWPLTSGARWPSPSWFHRTLSLRSVKMVCGWSETQLIIPGRETHC